MPPPVEEALDDAETVVIVTEWQQFRDLDPRATAERVVNPIMIDGRNCLPARRTGLRPAGKAPWPRSSLKQRAPQEHPRRMVVLGATSRRCVRSQSPQ